MMPTASRFRESRRFGGNSSVWGFENNAFLKHVWISQGNKLLAKNHQRDAWFFGTKLVLFVTYPEIILLFSWFEDQMIMIILFFLLFGPTVSPFQSQNLKKKKNIGLFWIQVAGLTQKPLRLGVEFQPQTVERFWWLWSSNFFRPWLEDSGTDVPSQQFDTLFDTLFDTRFGWVWRSSPHRKDLSRGFNVQLQHLRRTKQQHIICIY